MRDEAHHRTRLRSTRVHGTSNKSEIMHYEKLRKQYTFSTNLRNWDLAVDGSPIKSTLISPRKRMPSGNTFRLPPISWHAIAFLMSCVYSPDHRVRTHIKTHA